VVAALADGWEVEDLREGVGVVVVVDVAGFLPWTTEDTINTSGPWFLSDKRDAGECWSRQRAS